MTSSSVLHPTDPWVDHHRYVGRRLVSAASQIDLLFSAAGAEDEVTCHESLVFRRPIEVLDETELTVSEEGGKVCVIAQHQVVATARRSSTLLGTVTSAVQWAPGMGSDETGRFKAWLRDECPMEYGPYYDVIRHLERADTEGDPGAVALVDQGVREKRQHGLPVAYVDAGFQVLAYLGGDVGGLPWAVDRIIDYSKRRGTGPARVVATLSKASEKGSVRGNVSIETMQGEILVAMEGVTLRATTGALTGSTGRKTPDGRARVDPRFQVRDWGRFEPRRERSAQDAVRLPVLEAHGASLTSSDLRRFIDALTEKLSSKPAYLRVVTRNARATTPEQRVDPFGAAVGALLAPARAEYPKTLIQWIDVREALDSPISPPTPEEALEAVWADGAWQVPSRRDAGEGSKERDAGGRWFVIGGLSAVVRELLPVLSDLGCRELTLAARRDPSAQQMERIRHLLPNVTIRFLRGGTTELDAMTRGGSEPYDVVVNAAGVLDDRLLCRTTDDQARRVLEPKVDTAAALSRYSQANPDAKILIFSSTAAETGQMGQGIYAAANAYQDAVAHNQRCLGRPWYVLRWGLWEVGMGERIHAEAAEAGHPVISPSMGRRLLQSVLNSDPGEYWLDGSESTGVCALDHIRPDAESATEHPLGGATMKTSTADEEAIRTVCEALATTLGRESVSPLDCPEDLGMDSMMAVEVSAYLADRGLDLEATDAFGHATVQDLAEKVGAKDAQGDDDERHREPPRQVPGPPGAAGPASHRQVSPPTVEQTQRTTLPVPLGKPEDVERVRDQLIHPRSSETIYTGNLLSKTLPSTLLPLVESTALASRINEISSEDRGLVAKGEYFYEPVVEDSRGAHVKIDGEWKLNFASYSYLGLIGNEFINQRAMNAVRVSGTAAHGVRLLAGTNLAHRKLENRIATFTGREDAIVFSSGYMANVATIAALATPGDLVLGDSLNHASIVDGCNLSGAEFRSYAHNDARSLRRELQRAAGRRTLVVTDAVFSMDGDLVDLPAVASACEEFDASLMVDEAHSIGVLGANGKGVAEHYGLDPSVIQVSMGTLSKTIPSAGGYVSGDNDLIFALKNAARGWMFSAAVTPSQTAAADAAFEVITAAPELPGKLRRHTEMYRSILRGAGLDTMSSESPVVPIRCETPEQALQLAHSCQENGLFVQPITYPTVPKATPRLRTIVTLSHSEADLRAGADVIIEAARRNGLI